MGDAFTQLLGTHSCLTVARAIIIGISRNLHVMDPFLLGKTLARENIDVHTSLNLAAEFVSNDLIGLDTCQQSKKNLTFSANFLIGY